MNCQRQVRLIEPRRRTNMTKWRCEKCGNQGDLVFPATDQTYCVASNDGEEYIGPIPNWVSQDALGDTDIDDLRPIGCPNCHVWGEDKFEKIGKHDYTLFDLGR